MFLHRVPSAFQKLYPSLTWRKDVLAKTIYLTFDDGPIPEVTPWVLAELAKVNAKATFFCVGENIEKHPDIFQETIDQGHRIGNHTFNHLNGWNTSTERYMENVQLGDNAIGKSLGTELFRPPYGRITRSQIKALSSKEIIMWDVLTGDFSQKLSPASILRNSISATRSGSIVVFHDHLKAFQNLRLVLPGYLSHFKKEGYSFCPI